MVSHEDAERKCNICGDEARHRHFGVLACDSCKTFFRRAVRKGTVAPCRNGGKCQMTTNKRRTCQHCRFTKCRSAGMCPQLVMSEDERRQHLTKLSKRSDSEVMTVEHMVVNPDPNEFRNRLTDDEYELVLALITRFQQVVTQHPIAVNHGVGNLSMLSTAKLRTTHFAEAIPDLYRLTHHDRVVLLRSAVVQVSCMRYAVVASSVVSAMKGRRRPHHPHMVLEKYSVNFVRLLTNVIKNMADVPMDEPMLMLMMAAMYFTIEEPDLKEVCKVAAIQRRYLSILLKYLQWRRGRTHADILYPKILEAMGKFRYMHSVYQRLDHHIWLEEYEVRELNNQLGEASPYKTYSVEERNRGFQHCRRINEEDPNNVLPAELKVSDLSLFEFMNLKSKDLQATEYSHQQDSSDLFNLIESLDFQV